MTMTDPVPVVVETPLKNTDNVQQADAAPDARPIEPTGISDPEHAHLDKGHNVAEANEGVKHAEEPVVTLASASLAKPLESPSYAANDDDATVIPPKSPTAQSLSADVEIALNNDEEIGSPNEASAQPAPHHTGDSSPSVQHLELDAVSSPEVLSAKEPAVAHAAAPSEPEPHSVASEPEALLHTGKDATVEHPDEIETEDVSPPPVANIEAEADKEAESEDAGADVEAAISPNDAQHDEPTEPTSQAADIPTSSEDAPVLVPTESEATTDHPANEAETEGVFPLATNVEVESERIPEFGNVDDPVEAPVSAEDEDSRRDETIEPTTHAVETHARSEVEAAESDHVGVDVDGLQAEAPASANDAHHDEPTEPLAPADSEDTHSENVNTIPIKGGEGVEPTLTLPESVLVETEERTPSPSPVDDIVHSESQPKVEDAVQDTEAPTNLESFPVGHSQESSTDTMGPSTTSGITSPTDPSIPTTPDSETFESVIQSLKAESTPLDDGETLFNDAALNDTIPITSKPNDFEEPALDISPSSARIEISEGEDLAVEIPEAEEKDDKDTVREEEAAKESTATESAEPPTEEPTLVDGIPAAEEELSAPVTQENAPEESVATPEPAVTSADIDVAPKEATVAEQIPTVTETAAPHESPPEGEPVSPAGAGDISTETPTVPDDDESGAQTPHVVPATEEPAAQSDSLAPANESVLVEEIETIAAPEVATEAVPAAETAELVVPDEVTEPVTTLDPKVEPLESASGNVDNSGAEDVVQDGESLPRVTDISSAPISPPEPEVNHLEAAPHPQTTSRDGDHSVAADHQEPVIAAEPATAADSDADAVLEPAHQEISGGALLDSTEPASSLTPSVDSTVGAEAPPAIIDEAQVDAEPSHITPAAQELIPDDELSTTEGDSVPVEPSSAAAEPSPASEPADTAVPDIPVHDATAPVLVADLGVAESGPLDDSAEPSHSQAEGITSLATSSPEPEADAAEAAPVQLDNEVSNPTESPADHLEPVVAAVTADNFSEDAPSPGVDLLSDPAREAAISEAAPATDDHAIDLVDHVAPTTHAEEPQAEIPAPTALEVGEVDETSPKDSNVAHGAHAALLEAAEDSYEPSTETEAVGPPTATLLTSSSIEEPQSEPSLDMEQDAIPTPEPVTIKAAQNYETDTVSTDKDTEPVALVDAPTSSSPSVAEPAPHAEAPSESAPYDSPEPATQLQNTNASDEVDTPPHSDGKGFVLTALSATEEAEPSSYDDTSRSVGVAQPSPEAAHTATAASPAGEVTEDVPDHEIAPIPREGGLDAESSTVLDTHLVGTTVDTHPNAAESSVLSAGAPLPLNIEDSSIVETPPVQHLAMSPEPQVAEEQDLPRQTLSTTSERDAESAELESVPVTKTPEPTQAAHDVYPSNFEDDKAVPIDVYAIDSPEAPVEPSSDTLPEVGASQIPMGSGAQPLATTEANEAQADEDPTQSEVGTEPSFRVDATEGQLGATNNHTPEPEISFVSAYAGKPEEAAAVVRALCLTLAFLY
ncbi:hypothetical protein BOTBODRAFT_277884 [Botryobasidium botryosum FD-172 SS1]|uniref:Uncharacterized protein n=1 Tax=Botryobasidium botryosum (strain FD-172 SS1) TaxID=930990 RepID=A0A067MWQ1_BOTB1|nr:hypothetical protein BOTBODRAFT_277884 [Botryobasidium botryosum FD-172 SS1]